MSKTAFDKGLEIRREVLGADYVDAAMAKADDFMRPMQELSTAWCWGEIWSRPGLARRDRSLINIAMIATLNRPQELRLHLRAALGNGVTRDEIREVLLQVAVYAGVPAGMASFHLAKEVFDQMDAETG